MSDKKRITIIDPKLGKQIQDILQITVTQDATSKSIEKGKQQLDALESQYDFNEIVKEVYRQINLNNDKYDEENSVNLINYLVNQEKDKLQKLNGENPQTESTLTEEEQELLTKLYKENGEPFKDIFLCIPIQIQKELALQVDSIIFLKTYGKIEELKLQFKQCGGGGILKLTNILDKKKQKINRKTFNYLRMLYCPKSSTIYDRIITRINTEVFHGILTAGKKRSNRFKQFAKIMQCTHRMIGIKQMNVAMKKIKSKSHKYELFQRHTYFIERLQHKMIQFGLRRIRDNNKQHRKKKLPAFLIHFKIMFQNNKIKNYLHKWQNMSSRNNKFVLQLMVNIIQEKQNASQKNALYKIYDLGCTQPRKENSKINLKMKGRILENIFKSTSSFDKNAAYNRWRVKSNKDHLEKAVKGIAMHSKMNPQILLWRLKHLLPKYQIKRYTKYKRRNVAILILGHKYLMIKLSRLMIGFSKIFHRNYFGKQGSNALYIKVQFLKNLFIRKNEKIAFEMIKMKFLYSLQNKDNFQIAADKILPILTRKINIIMKDKFEIWQQYNNNEALQHRFFHIILKNKLYSVFKLIVKWKRMPDVRWEQFQENALTMTNNLATYARKKLYSTFSCLLDNLTEGDNTKLKILTEIQDSGDHKRVKLYTIWANEAFKEKQIRKCRHVNQFLETVTTAIINNTSVILEHDHNRIVKTAALQKMIGNYHHGLVQLFEKWALKTKFVGVQSDLVRNLVAQIKFFLHGQQNQQILDTLDKFRKNSKVFKIQRAFLSSLLMTKCGMAQKALFTIKGLPEQLNSNAGNKFQTRLQNYAQKRIKKYSQKALKENLSDGTAILINQMNNIFYLTMNNYKRLFLAWQESVATMRILQKCGKTTKFLETLEGQIIVNTQFLFANEREMNLKKNAIQKLLDNSVGLMTAIVKKWQNKSRQKQMEESLASASICKEQIEKIKALLMSLGKSQNNYLRQTLQQFQKNSIIQKHMLAFFGGCLDMSFGKVYRGFLTIKNLPNKIDRPLLNKCNAFENRLNMFLKKKINFGFQPLKNMSTQATQLQTQIIFHLIKKTESGLSKSFGMWNTSLRKYKAITQCKLVQSLYDTITLQVETNLFNFLNDRNYEIKCKAIERLIEVCESGLRGQLQRYRYQVQSKKIQQSLNSDVKQSLIATLNKKLESNKTAKLREVIFMFRKNSNAKRIMNQIFKQLLDSKMGILYRIFQKVIGLPERPDFEKMKKCSKLQLALQRMVAKNIKQNSWNQLSDNLDEGTSFKQYVVVRLIRATVGANKQFLYKWRFQVGLEQERTRIRHGINFFHTLNWQIQLNQNILKESRDSKIKESVILRLFQTGINKLRRFFIKWDHNSKMSRIGNSMQNKQKQWFISALGVFEKKNNKAQLQEILNKFAKNNVSLTIREKMMRTMLKSTIGTVGQIFQIWKVLPEKIDQNALDQCNKFSTKLNKLYLLKLNQTFRPFKQVYLDCQNLKIRFILALSFKTMTKNDQNLTIVLYKMAKNRLNDTALKRQSEKAKFKVQYFQKKIRDLSDLSIRKTFRQLLDQNYQAIQERKNTVKILAIVSMNKQQKCFLRWDQFTKKQHTIETVKRTIDAFSQINLQLRSSTEIVFKNDAETYLKQQCLDKLYERMKAKLNFGLIRWSQFNKISRINERMTNDQKSQMIKTLFGFTQNSQKQKWRDILDKFATNKSIKKRGLHFFSQLLCMGQGRTFSVFGIWKNLPNRIDMQSLQNCNSLWESLNRLQRRRFRFIQTQLKDLGAKAFSKKIQIIRQAIYATESKSCKFFRLWKKFTDESRILSRSKSALDFFTAVNTNLCGKFGVINDSVNNLNNQLKTQILDKMLYIKSRDIQSTLKLWHMKAQLLKLEDGNLGVVKGMLITKMKLFCDNTEKSRFRHALGQFFNNLKVQKKIRKVCNNLQLTAIGQTQDMFNKWKTLPEVFKNAQAKAIYTVLLRCARSAVKNSMNALKTEFFVGLNSKKDGCRYLVNKSHGILKQTIRMWVKSNKNNNIGDRCTLLTSFFLDVNKLLRLKFGNTVMSQDSREFSLKVDVINRLLRSPKLITYNALKNWKKQCRVHKIQKELKQKLKEYFVDGLNKFQNRGGQRMELRKVIHKFRKFTQQTIYCTALARKLFLKQFGRATTGFFKWKGLPDTDDQAVPLSAQPTKQQKNGLKLFQAMTRRLKNCQNALCDEGFEALNQQKKVLKRYIARNQKPAAKAISKWQNQAKNLNLFENMTKIDSTFTMINNFLQNNFLIVFDSERATKIKQQAIQQMLNNSKNSLGNILKRWLCQAKVKAIQQAMDQKEKTFFIDKMLNFIKSSNLERVRDVLKKFENNKSVQKVKNLVFGKILSMSYGQQLNRFQTWKGLPERRDYAAERRTNNFENKLSKWLTLYIRKQSFDALKKINTDGIDGRKDAVIYFIQETQSKYGKFVTLWKKRTQSYKENLRYRSTQNCIQFVNKIITDNMSIIIESQDSKKMELAIQKIFRSQMSGLETMFKKWKENARIQTVKLEFAKKMDDTQKKKIIAMLSKFLASNLEHKNRDILNKFHLAMKMNNIMTNFIRKLVGTGYGRVAKAIDDWKTIPEIKDTRRIGKFEAALMHFVDRRLRLCQNKFLEQAANGNNQKQRSIIQFIDKTMSGSKKFFMRWIHITQRVKILLQCEKTIEVFDRLTEIQRSNMASIFRNSNDTLVMTKALNVLFYNLRLSMDRSFKSWVQFNRVKKLQSQFGDENKRKIIKMLDQFTKNSALSRQRDALAKFFRSFKLRKLQYNFFKSLLHGSYFVGKDVMLRLKNLPERPDWDIINKTNSFAYKLLKFHDKGLNKSLFSMKELKQKGSSTMQHNMQIAFFKTINMQKDMFFSWKNQTLTQKCYRQSNQLFSLFNSINDRLVKNVLEPIKESEQSVTIKKQVLDHMYRNFLSKLKDKFLKWRYDNQQAKMYEQLQSQKENQMIGVLMAKLKNNDKQHLQKILTQFGKNNNIVKLQKRFINSLMTCGAGKTMTFLQKLKQIPERKDDEKQRRCNAFQNKLDKSYRRILNFSLEALQQINTDGNITKNRCVSSLINMTVGKNKFLFQQWRSMTFAGKQLTKAQKVISAFDLINYTANLACFNLIRPEKLEDKIRTDTILKLIENSGSNMLKLLNQWRGKVREIKFNEQMSDKNKEQMVQLLSKFLKNSNNTKLQGVLVKLNTNSRLRMIQIRIFKFFMSSTLGGVQKMFDSWKNIPGVKDYDQINMINAYERKIINLLGRRIKAPLRRMQEIKEAGRSIKQQKTSMLVYIASGQLKRAMMGWKNNTELHRQTVKIQKTIEFFSEFNEKLAQPIFRDIFLNENQKNIMLLAIQQMMNNSGQKLRRILVTWGQKAKELKIASQLDSEQKKRIIKMLGAALQQNTKNDLRKVLRKFLNNSNTRSIMKKVFYTLTNTGVGATANIISIWKNLPDKRDDAAFNQANQFQLKLFKLAQKGMRSSYKKIKDNKFDGDSQLQRTAMLIVERCQGKFKSLFIRWKSSTRIIKTISICKYTVNFMSSITKMFNQNFFEILIERKNHQVMIDALKKMANCTNIKKGRVLNKWRMQVGAQKILEQLSNQAKTDALKAFGKFSKMNESSLLRKILKKFSENANQRAIISHYMNKIMNNKLGSLFKLFTHWKSLPEKFSAAAANQKSAFEQKLSFIIKKKISRCGFNNLLDDNARAATTKKLMCNTIVIETRSAIQKMFLKWNNQALTQKRVRMAKSAQNFIANLNEIIQKNFLQNFGGGDKSSKANTRHFALRAIVRNCMNQKFFAMEIWKQDHEIKKAKSRYSSKFIVINLLKNLFNDRLKHGLLKIEKKQHILIIKGATNAVWMWKLACADAKQAKRFQKLYDQTQFLLSFLAIFEKKKYDNLQYSLNKIKLQLLNEAVVAKLLAAGKRYKKRTVDYNFYKWRAIARELKLSQEHYELQRNQYGNSCMDILQKLIARRENWSFDLILKEANLKRMNNYVSSVDQMIKFYLSRLRFGMKKIKKRSQNKQQAFRAFQHLRHMIMKKAASTFFSKCRENQMTDLRALQIFNLLASYQKQQYRSAFDKLKRTLFILRNFVAICQKFEDSQLRHAIYLTKQSIQIQTIKLKTQSLLKFTKINVWKEQDMMTEALSHWRQYRDTEAPKNPWEKRSVQYLAKNVKINPQVSFWRLKDYAEHAQRQEYESMVQDPNFSRIIDNGPDQVVQSLFKDRNSLNNNQDMKLKLHQLNSIFKRFSSKNLMKCFHVLKQVKNTFLSYNYDVNNPMNSNFQSPMPNSPKGRGTLLGSDPSKYRMAESIVIHPRDKQEQTDAMNSKVKQLMLVLKSILKKKKFSSFTTIKFVIRRRRNNKQDDSIDKIEKQQIIERDYELSKEINNIKQMNELIKSDLKEKENDLYQAFESISILNSRLNYMITDRVVDILDKFREGLILHAIRKLQGDE